MEKYQSIVGLSLYGEPAVLPLISLWGNDGGNSKVNLEILNSILIIGDVSIPYLVKVVNNPYEDQKKRNYAIYALSRLNYQDVRRMISNALTNVDGETVFLIGAVMAAGYSKYTEMTPKLIQISEEFKNNTNSKSIEDLLTNIARALKEMGGEQAKGEIKQLLHNSNATVRIEAIKSMIALGGTEDIPSLSTIAAADTVPEVRGWASYAMKAIKLNKGL